MPKPHPLTALAALTLALCLPAAQAASPEQKLDALKREIDQLQARANALAAELANNAPAQPEATLAQSRARGPELVGGAQPPAVAPIFEAPGVLTPKNKWILEPSVNYAYASNNRIALVGYTIIPALLIGLIDVREVKRNTTTAALTARYGLTNRFELEAKLPYIYRTDSAISRRIAAPDNVTEGLFQSSGQSMGDVEFTGRYQLNEGGADKPFYVASLRVKTRTGKDPFEVTTATAVPGGLNNQLQRTLPTGSGFYTLQPGLTVLYPTDPGVFFGGISYQHNLERKNLSLHTDGGDQPVGDIQPGGVIGFNFGLGLAQNEKSSFSIGYDHSSIARTKINGQAAAESVRTQLGSLLLGVSHRLSPRTTLNLSVGVGVTRDSPDVQLTVRLPVSF